MNPETMLILAHLRHEEHDRAACINAAWPHLPACAPNPGPGVVRAPCPLCHKPRCPQCNKHAESCFCAAYAEASHEHVPGGARG